MLAGWQVGTQGGRVVGRMGTWVMGYLGVGTARILYTGPSLTWLLYTGPSLAVSVPGPGSVSGLGPALYTSPE